ASKRPQSGTVVVVCASTPRGAPLGIHTTPARSPINAAVRTTRIARVDVIDSGPFSRIGTDLGVTLGHRHAAVSAARLAGSLVTDLTDSQSLRLVRRRVEL